MKKLTERIFNKRRSICWRNTLMPTSNHDGSKSSEVAGRTRCTSSIEFLILWILNGIRFRIAVSLSDWKVTMPKPSNDPLPSFLVKPEIPSPKLRGNNSDDRRECTPCKRERRRLVPSSTLVANRNFNKKFLKIVILQLNLKHQRISSRRAGVVQKSWQNRFG